MSKLLAWRSKLDILYNECDFSFGDEPQQQGLYQSLNVPKAHSLINLITCTIQHPDINCNIIIRSRDSGVLLKCEQSARFCVNNGCQAAWIRW